MKMRDAESMQDPIVLRFTLPDHEWAGADDCFVPRKLTRDRRPHWTVGRLRQCTERKIDDMERKEVGLRRFLLVQSCLQAVLNEPLEQQVDTIGGSEERGLEDNDMLLAPVPSAPLLDTATIKASCRSAPPRRRPSVHCRPSQTAKRQHGNLVQKEQAPLDCRPPKKRRIKRLLKDSGRPATLGASGGMCTART